jgi:fluoroquinolone transport system permease protein
MRRLAATLWTDVRVQYRNGFYFATLFVLIISIVLLRAAPGEIIGSLLPTVIIGNVLINAFYFAGGLVLLERTEGTLLAQAVTPLQPGEYLASKLVTLTAVSLIESLVLAAAVLGLHAWLAPMAVGIALTAAVFCLVGIAVVVRYESINEFLLPSVLYSFVLCLPLLDVLGVGRSAWYWLHPLQGVVRLMQIEASLTLMGNSVALLYPLACAAAVYVWCRRALLGARA